MIHVETEFPHPGSRGFLLHTAEPVKVIQTCADGRLLVTVTTFRAVNPEMGEGQRTMRVPAEDVFADPERARFGGKPPTKAQQRAREAALRRNGGHALPPRTPARHGRGQSAGAR